MEKDRYSARDKLLRLTRNAIFISSLLIPTQVDKSNAQVGFENYATITGYYCQRIVGYPGYDFGGYCNTPAYGGNTISGITAACGRNWEPYSKLQIEGYPHIVFCNDKGNLAPNQIDIFFQTDKELHDAIIPRRAKVVKVDG
jgi:hypothetical protein